MLLPLSNEHKVGRKRRGAANLHYKSFSTEILTLCTCHFDKILNRGGKLIVLIHDRTLFLPKQLKENHSGAVCDFRIPSHANIIPNVFVGSVGFHNLEKQMILSD